jgi:antirestriction protein ArdC
MKKTINVYDEVTSAIIAQLEAGVAPWIKPWDAKAAHDASGGVGLPFNAVTKRPYSGVNVILLWMFGPSTGPQAYMTFNQAKKLGANVRAGSKGFRIVYADSHTKRKIDANGNESIETYAFLKKHTVFHISQIENLPEGYPPEPRKIYEQDQTLADDAFNLWIDCTRAVIRPGGSKAFYSPAADAIGMPPLSSFRSADDYMATLLHELTHWTGAKHRLNRDFSGRFGSTAYAREELVAEMGAAFLCARLDVAGKLQHAEYLATWIKVLKEDNKAIFKAASAAQKASEYLWSLQDKARPRLLPVAHNERLPAVIAA